MWSFLGVVDKNNYLKGKEKIFYLVHLDSDRWVCAYVTEYMDV